jgi:hypothetical protein
MNYQVDRYYKDQMLSIPVRVREKCRIAVKVYNATKPYTTYFDAAPIIEGEDKIIVKIPKMPKHAVMEIYNEANGNLNFDSSFQVGTIAVDPIKINFSIASISDPTVSSFATFSDEFAEQAGVLSTQKSIYTSPDGNYTIHYLDVIRDDKGNELRTPARINTITGVIEIAKKYYINYTVPGRKAINWHEFSHLWRNVEMADEIEADKNAIMIYLATGNPTCEAYNVFLKVYKGTPTKQNVERYNALDKFIRNFNQIIVKQLHKAA